MANHLVKLLIDQDGNLCDPVWHLNGGVHGEVLCTGEYFSDIESDGNPTYELKHVQRGGITCPKCISVIMEMKNVKL